MLCTPILSVWSQVDTIKTSDDIDMRMEDIISNTQTDENVDYTIFTDFLDDARRRPLNLNAASREELLQLPGINDLLVNNLYNHIAIFGELTSIYELQAIAGFTPAIVEGIAPFVTTDARAKDIDPNRLHPKAPPISIIKKGMQYEFTQRVSSVLEQQAGYLPPTYNPDGTVKSHYLGSPIRSYSRFRARFGQNVSIALTGEKDAGEKFMFSKENKTYGYDFLSGHIAIANFGNLKSLVIGDFNIQTGQGLIFSSGLGFGKGAEVILAPKMPTKGIRPYASVNENMYRRGIAMSYAIKRVHLTGFVSRAPLDGSASYQSADTLGNDDNAFSGFQLGGYHRTPTELAKKNTLFETSAGGRIEYKGKTLSIGASQLFQQYSAPIIPTPNAYNQFDFQGKTNFLTGVDFDWVVRNFNFFGEVARSKSGGIAGVAGMIASLGPKVDFTLHFRNFDKDFHSSRGYTFGEQPRTLQNERGLYTGLRIRPNTKWTISTFFDRYYFPWNRYQISYPSNGFDYLVQTDYTLRRGTTVLVRYRYEQREYNASDRPEGQLLNYLVPLKRHQFRVQFQSQLARNLSIRTRMEASIYNRTGDSISRGFVMYQDVSWKMTMWLKLTARYGVFTTSDYNSRIYAYENDVPGFFSIVPYSGTGSRYYLMLNVRATKGLDFWVRLAQTRYFTPNNIGTSGDNLYFQPYNIGSGLDEITGSTRSELRVQMRWTF